LYRVWLRSEVDPQYFVYALTAPFSRGQIEVEATGASSSMLNIGQSTIKNLRFALPPITAQKKVVATLDRLAETTDRLKEVIGKQIMVLHEWRQAVITFAVTGQLGISE
jgi:type I restriction enzyme S subunit